MRVVLDFRQRGRELRLELLHWMKPVSVPFALCSSPNGRTMTFVKVASHSFGSDWTSSPMYPLLSPWDYPSVGRVTVGYLLSRTVSVPRLTDVTRVNSSRLDGVTFGLKTGSLSTRLSYKNRFSFKVPSINFIV